MGKKELIIGALVVLILVGITYLATEFAGKNDTSKPAGGALITAAAAKFNKNVMYYFWGDGCPHCADLDKWVKEKGYDKTVKYTKLEVWKNPNNAALMDVVASYCKIEKTGMGVPFVYYKGKCVSGTPDAQSVFEDAAKTEK